MNNQQLEQQFIGKLFSYENIMYFCKDISVNDNMVSILTDKRTIKVIKSSWSSFYKNVKFENGNPDHVELLKNKPKPIIKSDLKDYIGKVVRSKRLELGYTLEELGDLSKRGKKFVWAVEKSESNFTIDNIEKLLNTLGLNLEEVIVSNYLIKKSKSDI
jgi:ribosomal protein L13E